jgi:hypothetical protein
VNGIKIASLQLVRRPEMTMQSEFLYHLRDTLILLGGEKYFADLLVNPEEIGEADIDGLRKYNGKLIDAAKDRLVNINKLALCVGVDQEPQ